MIGSLLGWGAAAGGIVLAAGAFGWALDGDAAVDKAVALAMLVPSLAVIPALLRDASRCSRRPPRDREAASAEAGGRIPWGRGIVRVLCAGPLSAAAAIGIGALPAIKAPWEEADRFIAGAFLTTLLWALAGVWSTTDRRLGLVAGVLISSAALSGALAAW